MPRPPLPSRSSAPSSAAPDHRTPRRPTAHHTAAHRSAARRVAAAVAFATPVALLATQLTLPAFADPATAVVPAAATAPTVQTFSTQGAVELAVDRDGFTVQAPKPKPKPKPQTPAAPTTAPAVQSVAASAVAPKPAATPAPVPVVPTPTPGSAQAIAADMVAARGWSSDDFGCLVSLWDRESGWRTTAANPNGAYGIPQAYPGSKMASAGADWQTNPATQITWGLDYIAGRYGTPCGAWAHSEAVGSY
ncbi:lytic transglycosylase domain-containing protein [Curtobacterium sp. MCPF17_011]|nr:lytic transglycosylase domain-containing protein [Curtobacterium sp. MCPF17_011]PZF15726.1 lytic transglycosylase domain-containing protein [Curtobacterium sp. MCPF17_011]